MLDLSWVESAGFPGKLSSCMGLFLIHEGWLIASFALSCRVASSQRRLAVRLIHRPVDGGRFRPLATLSRFPGL